MQRLLICTILIAGITAGTAHANMDCATTDHGGRRASGGRMDVWDKLFLAQLILQQNNAIDPRAFDSSDGVVDGAVGIDPGNPGAAGYMVFGPGEARLTYDRMADKYVVQAVIFDHSERESGSTFLPIPEYWHHLLPSGLDEFGGAASASSGQMSPSVAPPPDAPPPDDPTVPLPPAGWSGAVLSCGVALLALRRRRKAARARIDAPAP